MPGGRTLLPVGVLAGAAAFLVIFVAGLVLTLTRSVQWSATSALLIQPRASSTDALAGLYDTLSRGQVPATYAEIFRSPAVLDSARARAGLPRALAADTTLTVSVVADTSIVDLTATGPSATAAVRLADAAATAAQARTAALSTPYPVRLASSARGTAVRSGPGTPTLLGVTALVALAAGIAVQQAWSGFHRRGGSARLRTAG